jgi:hypothetical protein
MRKEVFLVLSHRIWTKVENENTAFRRVHLGTEISMRGYWFAGRSRTHWAVKLAESFLRDRQVFCLWKHFPHFKKPRKAVTVLIQNRHWSPHESVHNSLQRKNSVPYASRTMATWGTVFCMRSVLQLAAISVEPWTSIGECCNDL